MNPVEIRLRDAFLADAETIRPESVPGPPVPGRAEAAGTQTDSDRLRRAGRDGAGRLRASRIAAPLATAAAVALIAGAAAIGLPRVLGSGHRVPGSGPAAPWPPGPPPFIAAILSGGGGRVLVFNSQTGRQVGSLPELAPGRAFEAVAAATPRGTFVAAATQDCRTWFYRFRITAQGQATALTPLRAPGVAGRPSSQGGSLAVSADGGTLAYSTQRCGADGLRANAGQVGVIRLASGKVTTWRFRFPAIPGSLTLSANGRVLSFVSAPSTGRGNDAWSRNRAYLLRTDAPGGPLEQHYQAVLGPPRAPYAVALNKAGTAFFAAIPEPRIGQQVPRQTLGRYRIPDGTLIGSRRVLPRLSFLNHLIVKPDPTGRFMLMYDWNEQVQRIDLATGTLTTVPWRADQFTFDAAW